MCIRDLGKSDNQEAQHDHIKRPDHAHPHPTHPPKIKRVHSYPPLRAPVLRTPPHVSDLPVPEVFSPKLHVRA